MLKTELDMHTHTLASGHAYGTIREMAQSAADMGLKLLGITEHTSHMPGTCQDIYFHNLFMVPRILYGVELMLGGELNILDKTGAVDGSPRMLESLDIRIASQHKVCYEMGTPAENTDAVVAAIMNPDIDIIGHPDDGVFELDYPTIVAAAKQYHTLLEINNNSLAGKMRLNADRNTRYMLELCAEQGVPVVADSDAHDPSYVGRLGAALALLEEVSFPRELIMNLSAEKMKAFIAENAAHRSCK